MPWNALSTKPGPYSLLEIWTQALPHWVVVAVAGSVAAVLRPQDRISPAAAAGTLLLMDMTVPFVNDGRALCAALVCWSVDERGPGQDRNGAFP
jgi:hypothetical protein